jgi:hypothetical protein
MSERAREGTYPGVDVDHGVAREEGPEEKGHGDDGQQVRRHSQEEREGAVAVGDLKGVESFKGALLSIEVLETIVCDPIDDSPA